MIYKPWQREDDRTTGDSQRCYLDTRKPFHLEYLPVLEPQLCICASFLWVLFNCWFFSLNLLPFLQLSAFPFRSSSFSCPSLIPSYTKQYSCPCSGAQPRQKHPGLQPHHQHFERSLGSCHRSSPAVPGGLLSSERCQAFRISEFPTAVWEWLIRKLYY